MSTSIIYNTPFQVEISDSRLNKRIETSARKIHMDIEKKRIYPLQKLVHRLILIVGIKPFVKKKGPI